MLKCAKNELLPVLTFIFNLIINTRTFPSSWKLATVTPLFKSGSVGDPNNYRPISVLSTIGKLLERCIHTQTYDYLTRYNLLNGRQSGIHKGHSTDTCVIDMLDNIYQEVDGGGVCGVLFVDLSKASDTVNHSILVHKLKRLSFRESVCSWFSSYFGSRFQHTRVGSILSSPRQMNSGVPQGSILGPLLFICYINDLPSNTEHSLTFLYTDDTTLLVKGKKVNEIEAKLTSDLHNINNWFRANQLALNSSKTKCMLFSSNRFQSRDIPLNIAHPDESGTIEQCTSFKYLGLSLDPNLNFNGHANKICSKVKARTGILWRMRSFEQESSTRFIH